MLNHKGTNTNEYDNDKIGLVLLCLLLQASC